MLAAGFVTASGILGPVRPMPGGSLSAASGNCWHGHLEEGEAGAVIHLEEGMERPTFESCYLQQKSDGTSRT
jgi:hypothetical protein